MTPSLTDSPPLCIRYSTRGSVHAPHRPAGLALRAGWFFWRRRYASRVLDSLKEGKSMEVKKGIEIIEAACRVPLKQIAANSGEQGEVIIEKLLSGEKGDDSIGWVSDLPCDIRREGG